MAVPVDFLFLTEYQTIVFTPYGDLVYTARQFKNDLSKLVDPCFQAIEFVELIYC